MASRKCVHKGCGKTYIDPNEGECLYHPGPPVFHEGQKGWKCCKPRVLTFDEFLTIPPCTTGKHSHVEDTEVEERPTTTADGPPLAASEGQANSHGVSKPVETSRKSRVPVPQRQPTPPPAATPESESDDASIPLNSSMTCRRRGCHATFSGRLDRADEKCLFHPGPPIFHDGGKGYTCCRRRVLEFDQFMKLEGCTTKGKHRFVGSETKESAHAQSGEETMMETVRNDYFQTGTNVIVSFYLKNIDSSRAEVKFSSPTTVMLDLATTDRKRYRTEIPLYGPIDPQRSTFRIMGTKLEMTLVKADGSGWPALRSDGPRTGEIIQVGRAARALPSSSSVS